MKLLFLEAAVVLVEVVGNTAAASKNVFVEAAQFGNHFRGG
jgi:hypothetical protein